MHRFLVRTGLLALTLAPLPASAQHGHAALVTSDGSGGGHLHIDWDFELRSVARLQHLAGGLFNGTVPGFNDGAGNGVTRFPLTSGTEVDIELMSIGEGLVWEFSNGTLATPGDRALLGTMPSLHNHPDYNLTAADDKTFAEAEVAFRVLDASASPVYATSTVHSFRASNGYLPPLGDGVDEDADKALLKCQKSLGKTVRGFQAKVGKLLAKCFDGVVAYQLELQSSASKVLKYCNLDALDAKSLVGTIAAEKAKAVDKIAKSCGPLSPTSLPYSESQVYTHLGMAECRAAELTGATYNSAALHLGELLELATLGDAHTVIAAFPCLKSATEE